MKNYYKLTTSATLGKVGKKVLFDFLSFPSLILDVLLCFLSLLQLTFIVFVSPNHPFSFSFSCFFFFFFFQLMISLTLPPSFPTPLYMCLTLLLPPFPQLHSLSIRLPTSLSLYLTLLPTTPLPLPLQPFSHHTSPHISFSFFQPLLPLYLSLYLSFLSLSEM